MRISSRSEYGLRALLDLAQRHGALPATNAGIAARQQVPETYLKKLLPILRKRGLVRSVRGPQGGHILARHPARITLAEAVLALEDGYSPTGHIDSLPGPYRPLEVEVLHEVRRQIDAAIVGVLESTTLDDLCQRKLARERQIMFYI